MKRLLILLALPLMAQTAPPANVTMLNNQPRSTVPSVNYCSDGTTWVACASPATAGNGTRTTAAGTSDTQAVPVQGVTNGVPQNVNVTASVLPTGAATQATLAGVSTETTQLAVSAKLPASLGPKIGTASLSVVPASDGFSVVRRGGASIATGQVSVGTSSTLVAASRTGRQYITVSVGAANTCAFGNTGVTLTTGYPLQPVAGANDTSDTSAAVYAVCSATTTVSYKELY